MLTKSQKSRIQALRRPARACEQIVRFSVTPISGTSYVQIERETRPEHAPSLIYTKAWIVGPRGGARLYHQSTNI